MTDKFLKTQDSRFVRDRRSTAILNIDKQGYAHYLKEREKHLQLYKAVDQVQSLQQEMSDIKQMLQQLLNGKTNG
jgi:uncharacterized protein YlbG (UPF0298 family)